MLDQIAEERDDLKVVKVNIDEEPEIAQRYGVDVDPDDDPVQGRRARGRRGRRAAEGVLERAASASTTAPRLN